MAHELEMINGKASMAYAGEVPWHGLGTQVNGDLTPEQMLEAAGLDWTVEKIPAYANVNGQNVAVGRSALARNTDSAILDVVSDDWNPVQNLEAATFFNDFVAEGGMAMETAGSLKSGQIVWFLAKVNAGFDLFGGDEIGAHLLFTNYHKYGFATDVRFTPIRVVCNNTLTLSLSSKSDRMVKVSHRHTFDGDMVKETLGIAAEKLAKYKEMASFLGSKQYKADDIIAYFNRIFPVVGKNSKTLVSRPALTAASVLESQPGAQYAEGSFWQLFNASTFYIDHLAARSDENRLYNSWYGPARDTKLEALEVALEMAGA